MWSLGSWRCPVQQAAPPFFLHALCNNGPQGGGTYSDARLPRLAVDAPRRPDLSPPDSASNPRSADGVRRSPGRADPPDQVSGGRRRQNGGSRPSPEGKGLGGGARPPRVWEDVHRSTSRRPVDHCCRGRGERKGVRLVELGTARNPATTTPHPDTYFVKGDCSLLLKAPWFAGGWRGNVHRRCRFLVLVSRSWRSRSVGVKSFFASTFSSFLPWVFLGRGRSRSHAASSQWRPSG